MAIGRCNLISFMDLQLLLYYDPLSNFDLFVLLNWSCGYNFKIVVFILLMKMNI